MLNANEKTERLNLPDSLKCQHTAKLTAGHCLYSDMGRVLAAITADTCGWSDSLGGVLCAEEVAQKYGQGRYQELRNGFFRTARQPAGEIGPLGWGLSTCDDPKSVAGSRREAGVHS